MNKKVKFSCGVEENDIEKEMGIRYDYYPGREYGETFDEEYINIYKENSHIFISRDYDVDNGGTEPRFLIIETNTKTKKERVYRVELVEERDASKDLLTLINIERKDVLNLED